jgi:hypothetical protein
MSSTSQSPAAAEAFAWLAGELRFEAALAQLRDGRAVTWLDPARSRVAAQQDSAAA